MFTSVCIPQLLRRCRVFLILTLTFLEFSCNKDNSVPSSYHLTCTVNGLNLNFSVKCLAHITYYNGKKQLTIVGYNNLSDSSSTVGFTVLNDVSTDSLTTGVYMDTSTLFSVLASYELNIAAYNTTNYVAGTTLYQEAVQEGFTPGNHFSAVITSWTSNTVRGTFSGDFYHDEIPLNQTNKKTITRGDFYVKIQ